MFISKLENYQRQVPKLPEKVISRMKSHGFYSITMNFKPICELDTNTIDTTDRRQSGRVHNFPDDYYIACSICSFFPLA